MAARKLFEFITLLATLLSTPKFYAPQTIPILKTFKTSLPISIKMQIKFCIFLAVLCDLGFCRSAPPFEKPLNPSSILIFQNLGINDCLNEDLSIALTHDESSEMPHHEPMVPMTRSPLLSGGRLYLLISVVGILLGIYVFYMVRLCVKRLHKRTTPPIVVSV